MIGASSTRRAAHTFGGLIALLLLSACSDPPQVRLYGPDAYPERLSAWGLLERRGDALVLGAGVEPYEIGTPLFSDYALKLRTYYLPPGTAMRYRHAESFDFPVGSVVSKTFFYPTRGGAVLASSGWDGDVDGLDLDEQRLVETRLLVRQTDGWDALPYVWDGNDAYLRLTGDVRPMQIALADEMVPLAYVVPARSECASCHATDHTDGRLQLIGLKARHLNRTYPGSPGNQLSLWAARGDLTELPLPAEVPRTVAWNDPNADLAERARAYLDINCGHCHNPAGAADTSGLLLDAHTTSFRQLGFCKPPVAAGRGTGGRPYSIVPGEPDQSILVFRLETTDPATRMPETGRSLSHREAVALLRKWIAGLAGECA
ncbi:MAG: SO2930 family diheme c-type cytochrome [Pseudomonadales bacterium]